MHTMSDDTSATTASSDIKLEDAQEWTQQNGELRATIQQDLDLCHSAGLSSVRKTKKDDGPLEIFCGWIVEHQIGLAVNLLMLLSLTHLCFPRARRHTRKFFELSYYNPQSGEYCAGWNDAWMVFFWIVVFTGLRAAVMDYILSPFAKYYGVDTKKNRTRFAEQAWLLVFYSVFWPLGMHILYHSDYMFNLKNLWTNWPNREMGGISKWYILVQYAFWLQQFLVIHIEARRKDHWQMFTHHIVTTALIFCAYGYHQTKVAHLILCIMDIVDLFLPLAKCLKYMGFTWICDVIFGVFLVTWVLARHVSYLMICYSVWSDIPATIDYGCYSGRKGAVKGPFPAPDKFGHLLQPFRDPEGVVCFNHEIKWAFLSALLFLQGITIMWFAMIMRVAIKVLRGASADDVRSDDEEEEEHEIINEKHAFNEVELPPLEEEVGVEAINLKGRTSNASRYRKSATSATGVSLPGHSDRKELLGRIGCDKGV
ncbi:TLC domain-containing protein [Halenospora varia]|nr:TLC domain-containing protein [Halenospora varia]